MEMVLENDGLEFIIFDNLLDEKVEYPGLVTDKPVEGGASISDHIQPQSLRLTLTLEVTETPDTGSRAFREGALAGLSGPPRTRAALRWLRTYRGEPLRWFSEYLQPLTNLGIENISTLRDNRARLVFKVRMRRITEAFTQTVEIPPRLIRPQKGKPETDKGRKSKKEEILGFEGGLKSIGAFFDDFFTDGETR